MSGQAHHKGVVSQHTPTQYSPTYVEGAMSGYLHLQVGDYSSLQQQSYIAYMSNIMVQTPMRHWRENSCREHSWLNATTTMVYAVIMIALRDAHGVQMQVKWTSCMSARRNQGAGHISTSPELLLKQINTVLTAMKSWQGYLASMSASSPRYGSVGKCTNKLGVVFSPVVCARYAGACSLSCLPSVYCAG